MTDFDRVYKLTAIRAPELVDVRGLDRSFFEALETVDEITDQRIEYRVEKHLKTQPNTAEVVLTNLNSASRDAFVRGPMRIRLEAGYDATPRLLFIGDLRHASNEYDGTEWLTKLQIADASRAYAEARVNRTYAPGTPYLTILADVAKAFRISLPVEVSADPAFKARVPSGEAIGGYASDEMTRILASLGYEWSFQSERLQVLRVDTARVGTRRLLAPPPEGGMIGSPTIEPPKIVARKVGSKAKRRVPKLTLRHILFPELTPGEKVIVQSRSINGDFRIDTVTHEGDTFGDEWITTVEATEI